MRKNYVLCVFEVREKMFLQMSKVYKFFNIFCIKERRTQ